MDLLSQFIEKKKYFLEKRYESVSLKAVQSDYYDQTLSVRKQIVNAPCESHLCKCIIMENTCYKPEFESKYYQKYYCIVVQYIQKMNVMKLEKLLKDQYNINNTQQLSKANWHLRLLKEDENECMTGYIHNSVEPFLMKTPLPLLISKSIADNRFLWLGGGHTDLKIRISVEELLEKWDRSELFIIDF